MAIEAALLKPIVDSILALVGAGKGARLKSNAEKAVREAIRELLQADPNEDAVAAKLAIAKAAGLLSHEVVLAESMLTKVRSYQATRVSTSPSARRGTSSGGASARKSASKTAGKQAAKKASAKKASSKRATVFKPAAKKAGTRKSIA
ncbi:hypothetical protein [Lysobacter humi (ex Lee et al. 2017)]